ncbi:alpha/beta hydrolase [Streptomyces sp. NEAU-Y11]|uniref:alpha/beta hydrolase n=1 Tax=Streptomyces cucumeris TaxID=2962890 RepID=UPI0020C917BB|nr:alpha/beta fold hydrolase [Streptomyces sp. NEAU-Y11]MCP9207770.1 alpha/beta hydrolase [Streptomyces sp. NEAU-Y11]
MGTRQEQTQEPRRFFVAGDGERLGCAAFAPAAPAVGATAVVLHGAGTSDKERMLGLMRDLAATGRTAVACDFSGHGESSGELGELSLERRFTQARALIDQSVPASDELVLIGFSMSGQTVADLLVHYGPRVTTIGLCAPAVYARDAWQVPFRAGSGFTEIIRTPESWRSSAALDTFRAYRARAVLAVPARDEVIPPEVTEAVADALAEEAVLGHLVLPEAEHWLGAWFRDQPGDRRRFVRALVDA